MRTDEKKKQDKAANAARMVDTRKNESPQQKEDNKNSARLRMQALRAKRKEEEISGSQVASASEVSEEVSQSLVPNLTDEPDLHVAEVDPYEGEVQYYDGDLPDVQTDLPDHGPTYEVVKILGRRFNKDLECYEFHIKWKGWPDSANSWEIEDNLTSFTRDVESFKSESQPYTCCIKSTNINPISF